MVHAMTDLTLILINCAFAESALASIAGFVCGTSHQQQHGGDEVGGAVRDVVGQPLNVRFEGESGHCLSVTALPVFTQSGHRATFAKWHLWTHNIASVPGH